MVVIKTDSKALKCKTVKCKFAIWTFAFNAHTKLTNIFGQFGSEWYRHCYNAKCIHWMIEMKPRARIHLSAVFFFGCFLLEKWWLVFKRFAQIVPSNANRILKFPQFKQFSENSFNSGKSFKKKQKIHFLSIRSNSENPFNLCDP